MTQSTASVLTQMGEHILETNYRETTRDFCELIREGAAPMALGLEGMRVASPFLNVPSHVMMTPNGDQRTVNFDHALLGMWRATRMRQFMPKGYAGLPMAQAFWYLPQGLDIWGQLLCEFPGHYATELVKCPEINLKGPTQHFQEYPPLTEGPFEERLQLMLDSIVQGDKEIAFRAFLGLADEAIADEAKRKVLASNILFAGIIDLPGPRMVYLGANGSHKAQRARAMVDLADAVGWENAYPFFFAVIPDLCTNPRSYDLFDTAGSLIAGRFGANSKVANVAGATSAQEMRHTNIAPLNGREVDNFIDVMFHASPDDTFRHVTGLLAAGKSLVAINDVATLAASRLMASIQGVSLRAGFLNASHCHDYTNVVGYWLREYDHEQQIKAAYFSPFFVNETVRAIRRRPQVPGLMDEDLPSSPFEHAAYAENLSLDKVLIELVKACDEQRAPEATALVDSYLSRSKDRKRLISALAFNSAKWEGDPHVMQDAMSTHEEYAHSTLPEQMRDDHFRAWTRYLSRSHKRSYEFNCFEMYKGALVD